LIKSINYDSDFSLTFGGDYLDYIFLVLNENRVKFNIKMKVEEYRFANETVASIFKHRAFPNANISLDIN
jgi:hypothetical protein